MTTGTRSQISEEDLDRAMCVYTPEEAMDFLKAGDGLPLRREPTAVWQEFLARMRAAPQTPATQAAIRVAQRELLWRPELYPRRGRLTTSPELSVLRFIAAAIFSPTASLAARSGSADRCA